MKKKVIFYDAAKRKSERQDWNTHHYSLSTPLRKYMIFIRSFQ